jgi:NADPH:quinone reductase-like Zn-dependent oxidoreductase
VPARYAVKLPDEISFAEGTVITRHFPMAFNLLASKADIKPGEWVLVMGATGALGSSCVQVAKMLGGRVRSMIARILPAAAASRALSTSEGWVPAALSEAAEAHRILERNQTLGKIILDPTQH